MANNKDYGGSGTHFRGGAPLNPGPNIGHYPCEDYAPPSSSGRSDPTPSTTRGGVAFTPNQKFGWSSGTGAYAGNKGGKVGVFTGYTTTKGGSRGR